jgi:PEP-CTERM/exosortase A-associated glycosyltransferase
MTTGPTAPTAAERMPAPVIAHVLDHALPELSGYSIRSHNILRALRSHGLPVMGMAPAAGAAPGEDEVDGVPYVRLPRRAAPFGSAASMLALFGDLRRQLASRRVVLVHAHTPVRAGLPALWAARWAGVPMVYELRGLWEESAVQRGRMARRSIRYQLSRQLETWLMRHADALAAISRGLIDEAQRRGVAGDRILYVPNGVDADHFQPRPADAALAERHRLTGKLVFGFIGFFFAYEGIDLLVRALAQIRSHVPDARLLLVGDGDMEGELRAQVSRLQLDSHVVMTGRVPHSEVQRYYSVCDVLVYPRRSSRLTRMVTPLRPLEAMAMGKPVVASDLGGLREIVRHGETGLLVAPDDPGSLAAALARLAADPVGRRRMQDGARRFAAEERNWNRLAAVYSAAYARLLGARAAGVSR